MYKYYGLYTSNAMNYNQRHIPFKFIAAKWHGETLLLSCAWRRTFFSQNQYKQESNR